MRTRAGSVLLVSGALGLAVSGCGGAPSAPPASSPPALAAEEERPLDAPHDRLPDACEGVDAESLALLLVAPEEADVDEGGEGGSSAAARSSCSWEWMSPELGPSMPAGPSTRSLDVTLDLLDPGTTTEADAHGAFENSYAHVDGADPLSGIGDEAVSWWDGDSGWAHVVARDANVIVEVGHVALDWDGEGSEPVAEPEARENAESAAEAVLRSL
ncbi:hypothetical protein HDA32_000435 [Spinactinospora alkalitolerans]|uniref:DUF3558 domain-containing protein n=1 Tax=Spinactinospora alkalitolerans TaxID=687207 RepID=A0A852TNY4_9ACTN|nr:hypothetical protein [Spinactinospora alkalitolerans]NYE45315.1 hypothetical protein [Spinactinospora alkalitolerans]